MNWIIRQLNRNCSNTHVYKLTASLNGANSFYAIGLDYLTDRQVSNNATEFSLILIKGD